MAGLPEGFVVDKGGPPEGFVVDEQPSRLGGDAKQLGIGVGEGALEGLAQAVPVLGSVSNLARAVGLPGPIEGTKKLLGKVGLDPDQYPAQNFEQRVARSTGNVVGNPMTYGPGAIRNLVLAPFSALGSEALGDIPGIRGTRFEPHAKILGSLLAPSAASLTHRAIAPRPVDPAKAAAAERLRQEHGIETTAGEVTGPSKERSSLEYTEAGAGAPYQDFKNEQARALTRAGLRPIAPTAEQLTGARSRARTPEEHAAIDAWEATTNSHNSFDAVQAARPMIGGEIEHAAQNLEVHSDSQLASHLYNLERRLAREGINPGSETWNRLRALRDEIISAFDMRPGPRTQHPSWTGNWGSANAANPLGSNVVNIRPVRGGPLWARGGKMWEVLVDGVHESALPTQADAQNYVLQNLNNASRVRPTRLVMNGQAFHGLIEHASALTGTADEGGRLGFHAGALRRAIMDAAERTGNRRNTRTGVGANAAYERFALARRQYANLKALEHATDTAGGSVGAEGLLTPTSIRKAARYRNQDDYARGRGDFAGLARDSGMMVREPPQSGTAPRSRYTAHAIGAAFGSGLGGLLGLGTAGPVGAGAGAISGGSLGAAAAPYLQSRFVMNPTVQRYLRSGRFQPPPADVRRMRLIRHAAPFVAHQLANPYQP